MTRMDMLGVRAIAFQEGGAWVAQCVEHDIGAQAPTKEELRRRLAASIGLNQAEAAARGDAIPRAPKRFEAMWKAAEAD